MSLAVVVVGGSDAGIMAALRARELDRSADVKLVLADRYPNFSICGLPFYVSGEVEDWRALAHRTTEEIARQGIDILTEHLAIALDAGAKHLRVRDGAGQERVLRYDAAVIATGARPRMSGMKGVELPGVYPLHTMADGFRVRAQLDARGAERAVIVGGGYIGLEMADAFAHRGLRVTLATRTPTVMPSVDASFGEIVRRELERHGVEVQTAVDVGEVVSRSGALEVRGAGGFARSADLVLVGGGVEPNSDLARAAGATTGFRSALCVDRRMRTNLPGVLAAGDCVDTWHRILERPT
jgi:NADPH-dependent 2,4-dienoyl-CoA reductase/sulfur reductase-like enzyme